MILASVLIGAAATSALGTVKRVVIVKIDGLPGYYVDQVVKQRDRETGKSVLPWFDEVFYRNGTRLPNFYTRGMSLSGPSWGQLDTGQRLQIKGNVEYDRYTLRAYDYLNFFPYYLNNYIYKTRADMPAAEVLDQLELPLLSDAFAYENKYIGQQLYQRSSNWWDVIGSGVVKLYPGNPSDMIDEWTLGLDFRSITVDQTERDITGKLVKRPHVDYYDYYDTNFDHVSHHNPDSASRLTALKKLDRTIGKIWVAIQASSRAHETALVLVSDHGFNSEENVYSQGFNIVKLLTSAAGGGHHVITKRRLMMDYSIMGVYPLVPLITTSSKESYYLKDKVNEYPTVLVDFDGNERSALQLRNTDLNTIHILLQQLKDGKLSQPVRNAAIGALFEIVDRRRPAWEQAVTELREELRALQRMIENQDRVILTHPKIFTPNEITKGIDKQALRLKAQNLIAKQTLADYTQYILTVSNLLRLRRETFNAKALRIEDLVGPGVMGDPNTIYELRNYVAGPSPSGLALDAAGRLDMAKSFTRLDYFDVLARQSVRNNVQPKVSNRPIDFVAVRLSDAVMPEGFASEQDPIWLYSGPERQTLILTRKNGGGQSIYRYIPVANLQETPDGNVTFTVKEWDKGFPLKYFEDAKFGVPADSRAAWLGDWHTELEWLHAAHKTAYSNAIVGLEEQLGRHPLFDTDEAGLSPDEKLIRRLRQRQRKLTETDLLILANNHWNFDVRGFNPGGNHGSFFRVSTNSTFMIAGGSSTGIPRGLAVEEPYDGLSFVPTIFRLMGKIDDQNRPTPELAEKGFRPFPGRVVKELISTDRFGVK